MNYLQRFAAVWPRLLVRQCWLRRTGRACGISAGGIVNGVPGGILFARLLSPATESSQVPLITSLSPKHRQRALLKPLHRGNDRAENRRRCGDSGDGIFAIIALINGIIGGVGGWFGFNMLRWSRF